MDLTAIIFDFDGVLAESVDVKTRAFASLYKKYGSEVEMAVVEFHLRNGGMSRYEKFRYYHSMIFVKQLSLEEENNLAGQFSKLVYEGVINAPMVTGALEFLKKHRTAYEMHVASGTPHDEMQLIVKDRGLSDFFLSVYGSPRSKTEIITAILSKYGYSPKNVLMVGDALSDYKGAIESGVHFVGRVTEGNDNIFPTDVITIPDLRTLNDAVNRLSSHQ